MSEDLVEQRVRQIEKEKQAQWQRVAHEWAIQLDRMLGAELFVYLDVRISPSADCLLLTYRGKDIKTYPNRNGDFVAYHGLVFVGAFNTKDELCHNLYNFVPRPPLASLPQDEL